MTDIDTKEYLIAAAEHLIRTVDNFLISHVEVMGETCKECNRDRTCGESVHASAEQLAKAVALFKRRSIQ